VAIARRQAHHLSPPSLKLGIEQNRILRVVPVPRVMGGELEIPGHLPGIGIQRRKGDNLYANSIAALNPDTGKMAWYFQFTPHDTWDWENTQNPILFDAEFQGRRRKMVGLAASNGY